MNLETKRLKLNSFSGEDAPRVAALAGDIKVVEMTAAIPYPYEESMATDWIATHGKSRDEGSNFIYAIRLSENRELIGCINITVKKSNNSGILGYWIGYPYWGNGFCTEAVKRVVQFGFEQLDLNKISATFKIMNDASGRVMEKVGMKQDGILREDFLDRDGCFIDLGIKSILKSEYLS